jgi:pimeloyl-ACP methyl ester carboxylesterase
MASPTTHQTAETLYLTSPETKTTYAYRRFGTPSPTSPPLLVLMHFRGTMDLWDPLLINTLCSTREVLLLDNAGVGQSSGTVPSTIAGMAAHVIAFLSLLSPSLSGPIDLLGFSMGGLIAPLVHLNGPPDLIRKLVLAGTGVSAGDGVLANTPERAKGTTEHATRPEPDYDNCFSTIFFDPSPTSQAAGRAWWARVHERGPATSGEERSLPVSWQYRDGGEGLKAMAAAGSAFGDIARREEGSFDRLGEVSVPVLVAQGKDDYMIPSHNSWVLAQRLRDARLVVWPDSGHGFLYQFAEEFAGVVARFLDGGL